MSYFEIQQPHVEERDGPMDGQCITHPAYAQISANRVNGHAVLYGSEFAHQHYVSITIRTSEHVRSLSNDWHHGRRELIEVAMSEAQWATFVSAMNVGDGPCCTLHHINGEKVPQPPAPKQSHAQFRAEIAKVYEDAQRELAAVAGELRDAVGKRKAEELSKRIELIASRIVGSAGFVANQFDEHMESTTEKAKIEVNAFVEAAVMRAGLQAIAGKHVLALPDASTGEAA